MISVVGVVLGLTVSTCLPPATEIFDVIVVHGPIALQTDYTLAQIDEMAAAQARPLAHDPVGFYRADIQPSVQVDLADTDLQGCSKSVHVAVKLEMTNRQIQIAKELADTPCAWNTAQAHYRQHAAADDAVVSEFAKALKSALPRMMPRSDGSMWTADQPRHEITRAMAETVERSLVGLDQARADVRNRVDTPHEIAKLQTPCGQSPADR